MRKRMFLPTGLCLMLAFSAICVSADEPAKENVFEGKNSGVVITIPEEYQSLRGSIEFDDMGDRFAIGKGMVELYATYYPFDEEEMNRRIEEEAEAEANGEHEKATELIDDMQRRNIFEIIGLNEGRGVDDLIEMQLDEYGPEFVEEAKEYGITVTEEDIESEKERVLAQKFTEIGTYDGFTYILVAPGLESLKREELFIGYDDGIYDEFISLVENVDKIVENTQLIGGVNLYVPVDLAESGTGIHFETTDLDGNPVDSSDLFAGHPITMINLWATWCGPCIAELPELEKLNGEFQEKNCQIIGIVTDADNEEKIGKAKEILADKGVTYVNLASFEGLSDLLPLNSWPTSYFVDENGALVGEPIDGARLEEYPKRLEELLQAK